MEVSDPGSCREPPGRDTESAPTGGSLLTEIRRPRQTCAPQTVSPGGHLSASVVHRDGLSALLRSRPRVKRLARALEPAPVEQV